VRRVWGDGDGRNGHVLERRNENVTEADDLVPSQSEVGEWYKGKRA
jgi:hypothetical protein